MYHKTIFHTLPGGENAKFTIRDRVIGGKTYYYANVINTDIEPYKKLSDLAKETHYGIEITDGKQRAINYSDADELETDILTKYGHEYLETEI